MCALRHDTIRRLHIPLSEKTKNLLLMPLAISPILKWCALQGFVGWALITIGVHTNVGWLTAIGVVFAAPLLWCVFVIAFIFTHASSSSS